MLETMKTFEKVDVSKLSSDSHFKNDLGLDSLDAVEVVMAIEEEFMVEIPDGDAEKIQSCKGTSNLISSPSRSVTAQSSTLSLIHPHIHPYIRTLSPVSAPTQSRSHICLHSHPLTRCLFNIVIEFIG